MTDDAMPGDPAFTRPGRFFKGNIHTHSSQSDGALDAQEVCARYRDAGYDFLAVTDHFLAQYGFPITNTRAFATTAFTTILGAEVHAPATALGELWHLLAVGLPPDFPPWQAGEDAAALAARCAAAGAFIAIPHPGWYALTMADAQTITAAHAIEIYNHTSHVRADRGDGAYLIDQMLAAGHRLNLCAVDDAHFHCNDAFGGFVMVKAERNEPDALVAALKAGAYYSSQGPVIHDVRYTASHVEIDCSPAVSVMALGSGSRAVQQRGEGMMQVTLPLTRLRRGGFVRLAVHDAQGRRAWTNPVWL